jgi:hypothetical protein
LAILVGEFLKNEFSGISVTIDANETDTLAHLRRNPPALLIICLETDERTAVEILQAVVRGGRKFPMVVTSNRIRNKEQAVQISGLPAAGFVFLLRPFSLAKPADSIRSLVPDL